jgi:ribonuclease G
MTRERIHKTVQMLSYQTCPYCSGRGRVKSAMTMGIYALKELKKFLQGKGKAVREVNVTLSPVVIDEILKHKEDLRAIEYKFKTKISFISNPTLHIEDVHIA